MLLKYFMFAHSLQEQDLLDPDESLYLMLADHCLPILILFPQHAMGLVKIIIFKVEYLT